MVPVFLDLDTSNLMCIVSLFKFPIVVRTVVCTTNCAFVFRFGLFDNYYIQLFSMCCWDSGLYNRLFLCL